MRSFQETIRAINWRWITNKTLKALMYCINPLNFFKLILRLFKWAIYIVFGAIALGMLTLAIGNYAHAAEWVPAKYFTGANIDSSGTCDRGDGVWRPNTINYERCISDAISLWKNDTVPNVAVINPVHSAFDATRTVIRATITRKQASGYEYPSRTLQFITPTVSKYICPPDGKPEFTMGPKVTSNGTVCEKKPLQCLMGSIKDVNALTGAEFCRPLCEGIAGSVYGDPGSTDTTVSYFTSMFGSVQIQCYGQCSIVPMGSSWSTSGNIWNAAAIKFTGENCPIQSSGDVGNGSTEGSTTPVTPPDSSDSTNNAQGELGGAVNDALSNQTSGATGTATLNDVVDKIAETSNKEIKASSEQNAAIGKIIQGVGKDIQKQIYEAQLASSKGSSGASLGQIQTANAIKQGNAELGTKLDAIKDALEEQGTGDKPLPPGVTAIQTDAGTVYTNRNDWAQRNYGTVMQHHVTAMNSLPLFSSIGHFFKVDMGAGTCPQFSIDVPDIGGHGGGSLVFDTFCNADLQRIFEIIALCVKLLGLYAAFRIALLD